MIREYKIKYTRSAQFDVKRMRKYIIEKFKYPELVRSFDNKISKALKIIQNVPDAYQKTEFIYKGYEIHMRCIDSYLFFYIVENSTVILLRVLKDGMNWQYLVQLWIKENN